MQWCSELTQVKERGEKTASWLESEARRGTQIQRNRALSSFFAIFCDPDVLLEHE
jgi:hypothetical protein